MATLTKRTEYDIIYCRARKELDILLKLTAGPLLKSRAPDFGYSDWGHLKTHII